MARLEAASAGFNLQNFQLLTATFLRALRIPANEVVTLLREYDHQMPRTQQQYDHMMEAIRRRQHIVERMPGNLMQTLNSQNRSDIHLTETQEGENVMMTNNGGYQPVPAEPQPGTWGTSNGWGDGWRTPTRARSDASQWQAPDSPPRTAVGGSEPEATLFGATANDQDDSGTDTDTISSIGENDYEWDDIENMPEEQAQQYLFWM